jgi:hypothetical protein
VYGDVHHEINCCVEVIKYLFLMDFCYENLKSSSLLIGLPIFKLSWFFVQEKGENLIQSWNLQTSRLFCSPEELSLALFKYSNLHDFCAKKEQSNLIVFKSSNFQIGLCQRRVDSCSIQIFKLAWFLVQNKGKILNSPNLQTCMIFSAKEGSNLILRKSSRPFLC